MKTILNYSHPLGETARRQIREQIGEFVEARVSVQIDFDQPLRPQLERLVIDGMVAVGEAVGNVVYTDANGSTIEPEPSELAAYPVAQPGYPDYVVPPALAVAAAYVGGVMSYANSDAMQPIPPAMIVLRRAPGVGNEFVLAEILR